MNNWTDGYVTDIGYTFGYYNELNPLRSKIAFLNAGFAPPIDSGVHCELGFGQGISINIHAAATGSNWYGSDFNPSQASFAQSLALASGAKIQLTDLDFASFSNLITLPDFDTISLHGIWSWISDENRTIIVDFIKSKLKVGGLLYISYNSQPGWANFSPIRHLLAQHASIMGSDGQGISSRVSESLIFAEKFLKLQSPFVSNNQQIISKFSQIKNQDPYYLAHEYFNKNWNPMYFSDMVNWLEPSKVSYVCSANLLDHIDAINLSNDHLSTLKEIDNLIFKQTVRDFIINQQFRRDYWIKGPIKLTPTERELQIRAQHIILTSHINDVPNAVRGSLGEASLNSNIYKPLLNVLSTYEPISIDYLTTSLLNYNINFNQVLEAVTILLGTGHILPVQDVEKSNSSFNSCNNLNAYTIQKSEFNHNLNYLASPITGGGIYVSRFEMMFLAAILAGKKEPKQWATYALETLTHQKQKIIKNSLTLESDVDILEELTSQAIDFATKRLPILIALKVTKI